MIGILLIQCTLCLLIFVAGFALPVRQTGHNTLPLLNREKSVNRWDGYLFHQSARPMNFDSIHLGRIANPEVRSLIVGRLIAATT